MDFVGAIIQPTLLPHLGSSQVCVQPRVGPQQEESRLPIAAALLTEHIVLVLFSPVSSLTSSCALGITSR